MSSIDAPSIPRLTTLSKNALYAPLKSYIKDEGGSSNTSVNRNLKEKSLYSFLESVSEEYHSSRTLLGLENGAKNGGQGLKARHIEAKLGQRALSLIKGGIRTDVAKSTSDLDSTNEKPKPSSKRKRSNQIVRLHGSISHTKRKKVCKSIKKEKTNFTIVGGVLVGLNSMWNQYAQSLLSKAYLTKKQKLLDISEAASLMSTAELVGSFVRISRCQPCLSYQGKSGFLVDVTKNTWRIALPKDGSIMNEKNIKDITDATMFKCMIIPKQGTCIILYIPANEEKSNQGIKIQVSG